MIQIQKRNKVDLLGDWTKRKFWMGIVLGVCAASLIYFFVQGFRFGLLFAMLDHRQNTTWLSHDSYWQIDVFYGVFSAIIGQSICFGFWGSRAPFASVKLRRKRRAILHDQRALNSVSIAWIGRLATIFGLLLYTYAIDGLQLFLLVENYTPVLVLLLIVVFSHTWLNLRRSTLGFGVKRMLLSAAIVLGFGFLYSCFSLPYLNKAKEVALNCFPATKYEMVFPSAEVPVNFLTRKQLQTHYHIAIQRGKPIIVRDNRILDYETITKSLVEDKSEVFLESEKNKLEVVLHVDERVPMHVIKEVSNAIEAAHLSRVAYRISPKETHDLYQQKLYCQSLIIPTKADLSFEVDHQIHLEADGSYRFDGSTIQLQALEIEFRNWVEGSGHPRVTYTVDDEAPFGDFLALLIKHNLLISKARESIAQELFGKNYEYLLHEKKWEVNELCPNRLTGMR